MHRGGRFRRLVAKIGLVGLVAGGFVLATAVAAGADAPGVDGTPTATAVLNGNGTVTVTVSGSWSWVDKGNPQCDTGGRIVGWQVDWHDTVPGQPLGNTGVNVGVGENDPNNAFDNTVQFAGTQQDPIPCPDTWGPISHTYSLASIDGNTVTPCVVLYDVRADNFDSDGGHSLVAGDFEESKHNNDNSVEDPDDAHQAVCVDVNIPVNPDVKVVKTGPTTATVGTQYSYTLTASNTSPTVTANDVTITDVIPSNTTFVSASAPCTYDTPTTTVTCDVGTLAVGGSSAVTVTVIPQVAGQDIVNTATVTPDDITPDDNTSTWTISGPNVLAEQVALLQQPNFPG